MKRSASRISAPTTSTGIASVAQVLFCLLMLWGSSNASAQAIVLRDLSRIYPASIQDASDESLELVGGRKLSWDQVLQADVDVAWQQRIDEKVREIGEPRYRLKHRLQQNNVAGAYAIAKTWYQNEERVFVGEEANFMVCRAIMLGRLREGKRESVIAPMLQALILQQQCEQEFLDSLPDVVFAEDELKAGIHDDFLPVWSSPTEAVKQLKHLDSEFELDQLVERWPGLGLYLSSLAIYAQQQELSLGWNATMQRVPQLRPWQRVFNTRLSQTPLATLTKGLEGGLRISAIYGWASDPDQQAAKSERVLALLKIVANDGGRYPSVTKLALSRAIELTDNPQVQEALRAQLQQEH